MNKVIKWLVFIIIVVGVVFTYSKKTNNSSIKNDCLIENISSDPPTLDPHMCDDNVSARVLDELFEGLVGYNQKNEIELRGAERYDVSNDGLTYTFYLRKDAKWSNGDSVTADDYIFAFQRAITPSTLAKYSEQMMGIVNARKIANSDLPATQLGVSNDGNYVFIIKLEHKNQEFIHYLTLPTFYPLHKNTIEKYGNAWSTEVSNIVSNGPYKIVEWIHNGHVKMIKNNNYWNKDNVKIENIKFLMIKDCVADMNKFSSKEELISYYEIPANTKEWYKNKFGEEVVFYNSLSQEKLSFNIKHKQLSDVRVRKALSMTIDRDNIVKSVFKGGSPSYCAILEAIDHNSFINEANNLEEYNWIQIPFTKRVEEAKKLLTEAGYNNKNPLKIELAFPVGPVHKLTAETIQTTWNTVFEGIVICNLLFEDWKIFLQNQQAGKYDIARASWIADFNLPSNFSVLYTTGNPCNFTGYSNKQVDDLYAKSLKANTYEEYVKIQKEINHIVMCDYVGAPYASKPYKRLVSKKVKGADFNQNVLNRYSAKYFELIN